MSLRDMAAALSPTWLRGDIGERYLYCQAVVCDAQCDRVEQGTRAKMPTKCDVSCLPYIGRDRGVMRGVSETDDSYAARCKTAIYDAHFLGLASGTMKTVRGLLSPALPMVRAVWSTTGGTNITQWSTIADGAVPGSTPETFSNIVSTPLFPDWQWDTIDNRRRFWIVLYVNATGAPWVANGRTYGDGSTYDDGHLYGVAIITYAAGQMIKTVVGQRKAAHARCECVVVSLDDTLFDPLNETDLPGANNSMPDGNWANYGRDDGSGNYIRARSSDVRYLGSVS